jgi:hypothetical protein
MMGFGVVKADGFDMTPEVRGHGQFLAGVLDRHNAGEKTFQGDPQPDYQALGTRQDFRKVLGEGGRGGIHLKRP